MLSRKDDFLLPDSSISSSKLIIRTGTLSSMQSLILGMDWIGLFSYNFCGRRDLMLVLLWDIELPPRKGDNPRSFSLSNPISLIFSLISRLMLMDIPDYLLIRGLVEVWGRRKSLLLGEGSVVTGRG